MESKYRVYDIDYDVEGNLDVLISLPDELIVTVTDDMDDDELVQYLSNTITEVTDFCHWGFEYEKIPWIK